MKSYQRTLLVVLVVLTSVGCDQTAKFVAKKALEFSLPISLLGDFVRLQYVENPGILLSIGSDLPEGVRFWLFSVVAGIGSFGIFAYVLLNPKLTPRQVVAWSLLCSGGLGNLIDRIFRDGIVIDFVSVGIGEFRTAVFNVADVAVFTGVALVILFHSNHPNPTTDTPIDRGGES